MVRVTDKKVRKQARKECKHLVPNSHTDKKCKKYRDYKECGKDPECDWAKGGPRGWSSCVGNRNPYLKCHEAASIRLYAERRKQDKNR